MLKKTLLATATTAALLLAAPSTASAAPGKMIQESCNTSFGALVSGAKSSGSATHGNYAGGANAFANPAILAAHGCAT